MNYRQMAVAVLAGLILAFTVIGQEEAPPQPPPDVGGYSDSDAATITSPVVHQKKPGSVRIGLVTVRTHLKQFATNNDVADAVRAGWYSFLDGPAVEVVYIDSRLPIQINMEAEQQGCDYVIYSTVTQKGRSNVLGTMLTVAVPVAAAAIPINVGSVGASAIRNSVQYGATNAAKEMATKAAVQVASRDKVTLEYSLVKVDGKQPMVTKTLKAKAKSDGDDVYSSLIEQASEQILETTLKK
jgi:hypothetical protein